MSTGGDLTFPCADSGLASYAALSMPCTSGHEDGASLQDWAVTDDTHIQLLGGRGGYLALSACDATDGTLVAVYPSWNTSSAACKGGEWLHNASTGYLVGAYEKCLDEYMWTTPRVDLWSCLAQAPNEVWLWVNGTKLVNGDSGKCLTAVPSSQSCTNVWARPLSTHQFALVGT